MSSETFFAGADGRKRISFSQLSTYLKCPRQYKFKYRDKIPTQPAIVPIQSSAWHACVEKNYRYMIANKNKMLTVERMKELFLYELNKMIKAAGGWKKMDHGDYESLEQVQLEGLEITEMHHKLIAPRVKPLAAEKKFSIKLSEEIELIGIWDLLEEGIVADNKAKGKLPSQSDLDKDLQFTTYAWAHKKLYKKIPKLRMDILLKQKQIRAVQMFTTRTVKQLDWFEELVKEVWNGMKSDVFFPNTNGWHCSEKWCEFWDRCMGK